MNLENYKILKFANNEMIICEISGETVDNYEVSNPLKMDVIPKLSSNGQINEILNLKPWLQHFSEQRYFEINKSHCILIADASTVDMLINNAGIAHVGNIEVCAAEDLDRLYEVNIKGVYNCAKACIPLMKDNGGGVILNMASIASTVGISDRFAYSMTKGAVLTMTYSIAKDYIDDNIRCNCISPARVHTPFVDGFIKKNYPDNEAEMFEKLSKTQPMGRMGKPQEVADLALFLCTDEASFITGSNYGIDGGYITLNSK